MDGSNNRPTARTIRRVKTGCRTCKARRVKCDEQRPSCRRCTSTSRACMGYGSDHSSHLDLHLHRPSNAGPVGRLGAQDRLLLEWFMQANLQGVFPFPFWESLVPQACYSEPAVLSCVLALGSAHRRACVAKWSPDAQSEVENLEATGLRHYNTAINVLKGAKLERSKASTRVTLTACLTFVIIEYLHKRPAQALVHLQHGLQILQDNHMRQHASDPVDDWLAEAFDRLDVQARLLSNKPGDSKSCQNTQPKGKFLKLISLHEARQHLDLLLSEAYRLQHQGRIAEFSADTSLLFQALIAQQQLQDDLRSWLQAYRSWCAKPSPCSSQPPVALEERAARRLLLIYHTMLGIVTATALYSEDESVFDRHTLQFASIVAASKEILQMYQPVITSPTSSVAHCTRQFTFTSDIGLVPVLYYTALKCRDPEVRGTAVSMLDTQAHQEGIWEGPTAALIVAEMIRLEQESPGEGDIDKGVPSGSSVPQLWRVSDVQVELPDIYGTELVVACRRKLKNGAWMDLERRYDGVSWY
ncbi:C6 zinc finger domain-containing [Fusarium albosuccineum]|uniref:C6 zinc finger domain-containing n=1 Tax=Fusarium albosuccineum TaxID=1237068 RepID=A0A8H4LCE3_9HYPO|nr:C6 zinc finger domain-containing [Fusarium albosuccineum]